MNHHSIAARSIGSPRSLDQIFRTPIPVRIHCRHDWNTEFGCFATPRLPTFPKPHHLIPAKDPLGTANVLAVGLGNADTGDGVFPDQLSFELGNCGDDRCGDPHASVQHIAGNRRPRQPDPSVTWPSGSMFDVVDQLDESEQHIVAAIDHRPQDMRKISTASVVPNAPADGPFEALWEYPICLGVSDHDLP